MPTYTGDKILAAIFCGVCTGAGLAIVFMRGATTGGTDIVGRLVHKAFPHIQIGKVIMAADAIIVILGAVVFRSIESAMYAVIVISSIPACSIIFSTAPAAASCCSP